MRERPTQVQIRAGLTGKINDLAREMRITPNSLATALGILSPATVTVAPLAMCALIICSGSMR